MKPAQNVLFDRSKVTITIELGQPLLVRTCRATLLVNADEWLTYDKDEILELIVNRPRLNS